MSQKRKQSDLKVVGKAAIRSRAEATWAKDRWNGITFNIPENGDRGIGEKHDLKLDKRLRRRRHRNTGHPEGKGGFHPNFSVLQGERSLRAERSWGGNSRSGRPRRCKGKRGYT